MVGEEVPESKHGVGEITSGRLGKRPLRPAEIDQSNQETVLGCRSARLCVLRGCDCAFLSCELLATRAKWIETSIL